MIRVFMVEDDRDWARALVRQLNREADMNVVHVAYSAEETIDSVDQHEFDVVLMDLILDDEFSGARLAERILHRRPHVKLIVLSGLYDPESIMKSFRAGVISYVVKTRIHDLPDAIRKSYRGDTSIPHDISSMLRDYLVQEERASWQELLTVRELEALEFVAMGRKNSEIAKLMMIELKAVENLLARIKKKFDVHTRQEAVELARERGLIK